jgi:hypothetical protein
VNHRGAHGHSVGHSTGRNQTERPVTGRTGHRTWPARTALGRLRWTCAHIFYRKSLIRNARGSPSQSPMRYRSRRPPRHIRLSVLLDRLRSSRSVDVATEHVPSLHRHLSGRECPLPTCFLECTFRLRSLADLRNESQFRLERRSCLPRRLSQFRRTFKRHEGMSGDKVYERTLGTPIPSWEFFFRKTGRPSGPDDGRSGQSLSEEAHIGISASPVVLDSALLKPLLPGIPELALALLTRAAQREIGR